MRARSLTLAIALVLLGALATFLGGADRAGANSAGPDLVIESLTVSDSSPQPGGPIRLVVTVRNKGDARSSASRLRYYRSTESSASPLDVKVDENLVSGLGPSSSVFEATSIRAPTAPGRYYYFACVDSASGEANSTNNCSERTPIDVANAGSGRADMSRSDSQITHTCFTLVRSIQGGSTTERGSPTLLRRFLLASEVENLTGSTLENVYVEFEVANLSSGISGKHESERVNIAAGATNTIDPKKAFIVPFPNGTWIGRCTVKEDRRWFQRDVVLESESISFAFGTYPPPHIKPNVARGKLENCWPSHGSSYEVGQQVDVRVDPFAQLSESVKYKVHYSGRIYKDGKKVWDGSKDDNYAIILPQQLGSFFPTSPGEYTVDCIMYIEDRYDYDPIQAFLTSTMPCMKSLGLASICAVLVINVDGALRHVDQRHPIWIISNTFQVTPTGEVVSSPPDLVVDSPSASDSSLEIGETITLNATVRNSGESASPTTRLRYYRSTDATITTDDNEVGTSSLVDVLDVQESSRESTIVTATEPPGNYYYGACVVHLVEESNIGNNCSSGERVTITQPVQTKPDLIVETPSVSDSDLLTGESFRLRATVRNAGDGSSAGTTLHYYRSTDSTITIGDTQVESDTVQALDPSETDAESERLTARDAGTYYYGACVVSVADESNTQNNCSSGVMVTVTQSSPDLVVDTPTVNDASLEAGESFEISATVRNQGNGTSDATTLRYYRSTDNTISADDTEVGTDNVSALDPSDSDDERGTLTAPSVAGDYYYGTCVDSVANESNTENNCSSGVMVTVAQVSRDTVTQGDPDLVLDSPAFGVAGSLETGGPFQLSVTVRNQGNGTSAATTLRYYRSTDNSISTDDTEVGTDAVPSIGPSGTDDATIDLIAPADAGTYYYGACVDAVTNESNTQNNCSGAVAATVVEPTETEVDLYVSAPSVTPSEVGPGRRFRLDATGGITGVDEPSYFVTLLFLRSGDSSISVSDTLVGARVVALEPPSYSERREIILFASTEPGVYYYGACTNRSHPDETNLENNCSASAELTVTESIQTIPNLEIVNPPTVTDISPEPGGSFGLGVRVRNIGSRSPATTLRYYRSSDSTITSADTEVGTDTVDSLNPGQLDSEGITLTAPSDAGTYYYGACVDAVTDESDTTNNCS